MSYTQKQTDVSSRSRHENPLIDSSNPTSPLLFHILFRFFFVFIRSTTWLRPTRISPLLQVLFPLTGTFEFLPTHPLALRGSLHRPHLLEVCPCRLKPLFSPPPSICMFSCLLSRIKAFLD
ncbi:hypothetical protein L596_014940 [Steinernema carpocapsae]|uniref:Uncharacterized protein n=1 Tax=Steinernema carpocapsae TaxID=34508 RepID=A0A4U5NEC7_STECR|nr:hypothetical protein L596_014940 [Steinernema carpocapsae]